MVTVDDLLNMDPEDILKHNERPDDQAIRNKQQIYYDDVEVGQELPKYCLLYTSPSPRDS